MRIGLFPFVLAAGAAALAGLVVGGVLLFRGKRPLGWLPIILVLVPLAVIDGIVCLFFMISAALSHSAAAIEETPTKCLASTAGLVVLPAIALLAARRLRSGGPRNPGPPAA